MCPGLCPTDAIDIIHNQGATGERGRVSKLLPIHKKTDDKTAEIDMKHHHVHINLPLWKRWRHVHFPRMHCQCQQLKITE